MLSFLQAAPWSAVDHSFSLYEKYSAFKIEGQRDSVKEKGRLHAF
jgi:hypothetical protein